VGRHRTRRTRRRTNERSWETGPFDRFNDRAKRVLALAQDEAVRFNHNYIGTEHILLGLAREGESPAARALDALGVSLSKVRAAVEAIIGRGDSMTPPSEITLSPRTKKVIEFAIDEARRLGRGDVGPEHLLLGLLREGGHIGAKALESLGVTLEKVRQQVMVTMGQPPASGASPAAQPSAANAREFATNLYRNVLVESGPFDLLDHAAKRVLALADEEARRMGHNWIGTEHVLLALIPSAGIAQRALSELGITLEEARAGVFEAVPLTETDVREITVTPRVKSLVGKAIMLAAPRSDRVSPHHLLLALVGDPDGVGSQVLSQLGATPEKVRLTVDRLAPPG
jgi:ATP-dependent Clp protease ATP-binding subunit ClpA